MFNPGSIRKIQVKNFVTYSYMEMFPGPNLNMIIGPNGTGKSTIVAAIILGLGGQPKTVGRGTKISEYVKHNCNTAEINIQLQGSTENSFIKVTRQFDIHDKSQWKLDGNVCSFGNIQDCIKYFNIQVDNLCQFLPQDRVADFAKLNKKELLRETQIALCRDDLLEKQQSLIEARAKHRSLLEQLNKHTQNLQESHDANCRLEGKVKNFNEMKKYKEMIADIDRQIAWIEYEDKRDKLTEIKKDKQSAQAIYDKYRQEMKPLEKEIHAHRASLNDFQQKNSKITQNIRNKEGLINTTIEKMEALMSKVRHFEDEMNTKLAECEQWDKQIQEATVKLEDSKKVYRTLLKKVNQDEHESQEIFKHITRCTDRKRQLQDQRDLIEQDRLAKKASIKALQYEQSKIENVKQIRFEQLRKLNKDAYSAVLWLRENKDKFKGEIFEPIMLELNVLDKSKSKYVESLVPFRDRLAFTCTDKYDMNLFIGYIRKQQGLSVNVLHSGPASTDYKKPKIPIEHLRKFGFGAYVNFLFTAPEPIMRYLCQTYKLHNIPIGDSSTNDCYGSVPDQLPVFFSDRSRFSINYSKYSREKSTRQDLIRGDGGLSLSLDSIALENIKGLYEKTKRELEYLESQLSNYDIQIEKNDDELKLHKNAIKEIRTQTQQADTLKNKIAAGEERLKQMSESKKEPEAIRNEARHKMKKLIQTMGVLQDSINSCFKELALSMTQNAINSVNVEVSRQKVEYFDNQIVDLRRLMEEAGETLNLVVDRYNAAMQAAKAQLQKAKSLSNGFTPADDGFDKFRHRAKSLGDNIEQLSAEKENINSRIACLNTADDTEIKEYEDRKNRIEKLGQNIDTINSDINKVSSKMERLHEAWLTPLNDLIAEINLKFGSAFERMGCAGEVGICQGDDEKNYEDYGISIKVTYRNGELLQELNAVVQSGGERAVATAAFMLALQELTPVPFRCVDEINQGMDANNERRIFELIVETTGQQNSAQYFLITPKLVPNLTYSRQLVVQIVHNGLFIEPDRKWSYSKLCNSQGVHI
ncbi:hypothetical protein HUJ04_007390 [Dendroctonus ponderosae]|uniref:Structural maintenance of chromosomes protein 5 n=1 Tax=Dendroctonus ponderosae TaxID=77166 RepID=A0AAR5PMR7_DENPD|nr:hypothetical protein HUJ04_007390 [Dendroctonus ponderosae]